jgi:ribonuclease P protein subunit POP4
MFSGLLIGKNARVISSSDPSLVGISGEIVNETRNTFAIEIVSKNRTIIIPKMTATFEFKMVPKVLVMPGKELIGTPQERVYKH